VAQRIDLQGYEKKSLGDPGGNRIGIFELFRTSTSTGRPKIGLKAKGNKIAWIDVDRVSEPGEYDFRDGVIFKRKHLDIWKKDPDATFTLIRFVPMTGAVQIYGLSSDSLT
jgi:hypothetical protein